MRKEKKIKLLYLVSTTLPNERAHGIQIVNTCAGLQKAGLEVELCTPFSFSKRESIFKYYGIPNSFKHRSFFAFDIPHFKFRFQMRLFSFMFFSNFYLIFLAVFYALRRQKLVVYARGETAVGLLPITYLIPTVFETHQIRNYESVYKAVLKRQSAIVVITNNLKTKFVEEYKLSANKIVVARDAVDVPKFKDVSCDREWFQSKGVSKDKKIILYCGSLSKGKGVYVVAEAAKSVDPSFQIVFVGGSQTEAARMQQETKSQQNISVLGSTHHKHVPALLACAHALVQPEVASDTYSKLYTSPMKLFEYMASGRPIIASDVPSIREVLSDESALFFEAENAESLARVINSTLDKSQKAELLSQVALSSVAEYTWEKRGKIISDHINKVLEST